VLLLRIYRIYRDIPGKLCLISFLEYDLRGIFSAITVAYGRLGIGFCRHLRHNASLFDTTMRQSIAPTRASHAISSINSQPPNPAALARLQEKKKEFEAVSALEKASSMFVKRIEGLGDDCDIMADAGLVHGQVLEQWPNMFRILSLFLANRDQPTEVEGDNKPSSSAGAGSCLVRIPIDELQASKSNT